MDTIAQTPGVTAAAPLRTMYQILELPHGKAAVAAVAFDPTSGLGGPWAFSAGRASQGNAGSCCRGAVDVSQVGQEQQGWLVEAAGEL